MDDTVGVNYEEWLELGRALTVSVTYDIADQLC
jgi:hypothetical protein